MNTKKVAISLSLASLAVTPVSALAEAKPDKSVQAEETKRLGSLYLRCDGQPNNIPGMETFGRLVALSLVVGLLLPTPEAADPSKRLFGEKGVDACTQLLDGPEKREESGLRRIPLLLARGLHRIEAKDYKGAVADVDLAQGEAKALGLIGNPYFDRSMGLSFDLIKSEARLRMGDAAAIAEGQRIGVRSMGEFSNNFYALVFGMGSSNLYSALTPESERVLDSLARMNPALLRPFAARLEVDGRFAEAAAKDQAAALINDAIDPEEIDSSPHARTALSLALAGKWDKAMPEAEFAKATLASRRNEGKPESDAAKTVELLDMFEIVRLANTGSIREARRNFAARSLWTAPTPGAIMEVIRRLREGATKEELFGTLSKTPQELLSEIQSNELAERLVKDKDNKTLFRLIQPYAEVGSYEALSKAVWRTDKDELIAKEPDKKSGLRIIYPVGRPPQSFDAILLHSALKAKASGKQGFELILSYSSRTPSLVRFVDKDEAGVSPERFIEAEPVIADLRALIPSPVELAARKDAAKKK